MYITTLIRDYEDKSIQLTDEISQIKLRFQPDEEFPLSPEALRTLIKERFDKRSVYQKVISDLKKIEV